MTLIEVDSLQVQVIVDNVTDSLSSVPVNVIHEMDYLADHGMEELSGECLCCGALCCRTFISILNKNQLS